MEINCKLVVTAQNNSPLFCILCTILPVILPEVESLPHLFRADPQAVGCHLVPMRYHKDSRGYRLRARHRTAEVTAMKRTKLCDRILPHYCRGEEIMNTVTHIAGGGLAVIGSFFCVLAACRVGGWANILGAAVYCLSMIGVYTMSSIYHGLRSGTGKKVMQVIDHCAIYFLIAGTYTPVMITGFAPVYPGIGWGLLGMQWLLAALAVTLTAIDLKKYQVFSMVCYICMGWGIILFLPQTMTILTKAGFCWLLAGGIAYTVGAVLFGLGKKLRWMHAVFHIFVILGSLFQYLAIVIYLY